MRIIRAVVMGCMLTATFAIGAQAKVVLREGAKIYPPTAPENVSIWLSHHHQEAGWQISKRGVMEVKPASFDSGDWAAALLIIGTPEERARGVANPEAIWGRKVVPAVLIYVESTGEIIQQSCEIIADVISLEPKTDYQKLVAGIGGDAYVSSGVFGENNSGFILRYLKSAL